MKFLNLLPTWVVVSFPIIRYILMFILAIASVTMIIVVLLQEESGGGANVVTGVQESYYSQNKGKTREGMLKKTTIAMASIIAISIVLFFITMLVYSG